MTTRFQDVDLRGSWAEIPVMRRHLYFYLLLLLVTVLTATLKDPQPLLVVDGDDSPPRLTAKEVYSPPAGQ